MQDFYEISMQNIDKAYQLFPTICLHFFTRAKYY